MSTDITQCPSLQKLRDKVSVGSIDRSEEPN